MDTEYAKRYGAVEIAKTIKVLNRSERAIQSLIQELDPQDIKNAKRMIEEDIIIDSVSGQVYGFFENEIQNESEIVWSGSIVRDEESYPVQVHEYEGVFYVWAMEYDPAGYFLKREDAISYATDNWDVVEES